MIEDVLQFITDYSSIPLSGFDAHYIIHSTNVKFNPSVSTCSFVLTLPLHLGDFNKCKEIMIEAIISVHGFELRHVG